MKLIVDASVAIKWLIEEPDSALADRLLDRAHDFLARRWSSPKSSAPRGSSVGSRHQ
ncbi:MAG TPA: hypothetical protein VLE23_17395 [Geminicoccaceae bacterium]|nr:hypothetical protein [Geminicoccaceae bacterium]